MYVYPFRPGWFISIKLQIALARVFGIGGGWRGGCESVEKAIKPGEIAVFSGALSYRGRGSGCGFPNKLFYPRGEVYFFSFKCGFREFRKLFVVIRSARSV